MKIIACTTALMVIMAEGQKGHVPTTSFAHIRLLGRLDVHVLEKAFAFFTRTA